MLSIGAPRRAAIGPEYTLRFRQYCDRYIRNATGSISPELRLSERSDPVDAAEEQHALLVDLRIAEAIGWRIAGVFGPDAIELLGGVLAAGLPLPQLLFDRVLDLNPV